MKITTLKTALALLSLSFIFSCTQTLEGDLLIQNVNVINVETGEISANRDVLIIGDNIANIEEHEKYSYLSPKTIDATDKFLIPGLWDMHGHWLGAYEYFFPMLLANGVVGIRDMWGDLPALKKVRKLIDEGTIAGPDVFTAGLMVDGKEPRWPYASVSAATPEEGRKIVRQQKADGVDFIKVYDRLDRDVYFAIADECIKQNIPMVGHIPLKISLEEAINSNHLSIEHFFQRSVKSDKNPSLKSIFKVFNFRFTISH